ncbi:MAG: AMP-dependent synthetase, partial [Deltaproteobacteria bacterium]
MIETQDTGPVDVGALLRGRSILITGTTGFVGKVALSMLLARYPEVGRVWVLVRPGLSGTAEDRFFGKVIASPAFDPLRAAHGDGYEAWMREKCRPVAGDITEPNLGLSDEVVGSLVGQVDVVLNCAGMVDFTPPLDLSLKVNADGALYAAELCNRIGAGLVHVSTCFTAGQREGHVFEDEEKIGYYPKRPELGPFDAEAEVADCLRLVEEIKRRARTDQAVKAELRRRAIERLEAEGRNPDDPHQVKVAMGRERKIWQGNELVRAGMERAELWGWQNTYCYTKALGDQRIALYAKAHPGLRWASVKPAVVESALRFPFPGWNEGFTTAAPLMFLGIKGHRTFPYDDGVILDVIPVDLVAAGLIAVTALTCDGRQEETYQLCSGDSNPLWMDRVIELTALARRQHYRERETGNARINDLLSRIEPLPRKKETYQRVSVPMVMRTTARLRKWIDEIEPAWGAPAARRLADQVRETLDAVDAFHEERGMMFEIFMPFLTEAKYVFRADRMHRLMERMTPEDREKIPFDPQNIEWRHYWLDVHTPGLKKWVFPNLEEELESRGAKRKKPARDLVELLELSVRRHPGAYALRRVEAGRESRYTYRELGRFSDRVAAWLAHRHGVTPGDRVMLASENRPEWPMAYFGIVKAGAVAVPVDANASAEELANLARASGAKVLLVSEAVERRLGEALPEALRASAGETTVVDLAVLFSPLPDGVETPRPRIKPDSLASLIFTSGTTGRPKGVMLSHRNFTSMVSKLSEVFTLRRGDGVLSVLPLHHTFEFSCGMLTPLAQGAEITYLEELSGEALEEALRGGRITAMIGVPALWQVLHRKIDQEIAARGPWMRELTRALMSLNRMAKDSFGVNPGKLIFAPVHRKLGRIKFLVSGGSALSPEIMKDFQGLGFEIFEGYGLTESAPVLTVSRPGDKQKPGSVGRPLSGVEIRIDNPNEEGIGEILARGQNVMQGYFGDEAATREVLEDGWLRTGDLGRIDEDGDLYIVGRAKDVIVDAGGKNIYPDEVEAVYAQAEWVKELCVVGLPDEEGRGERVAALVVPDYAKAPELSREEVRERVRASLREKGRSLPLYRRIKVLHLWDGELPRTATRKVKRRLVVEELQRLERAARAAKAPPEATGGDEETLAWVQRVLSAVVSRPPERIGPSLHLVEDLGLDSLGLSEIAGALEDAGVALPDDVDQQLKDATVGSLAELVARAPRRRRIEAASPPEGEGPPTSNEEELELPRLAVDLGFRLLRRGQRTLYEDLLDVEVSGREHIPPQGNFIVASNHTSHLDMGLVKHALGEQGERLCSLAAKDYFFDTPLKRLYFGSFTNLLPMEREGSVRESLRLALKNLERGNHLLIFPEGTRSTTGEMLPFLPSVGFLALTARRDVLPMYLHGTYEALPKGRAILKRVPLRVAIGPVVEARRLEALTDGLPRQEAYRVAAAVIEDAVHAL